MLKGLLPTIFVLALGPVFGAANLAPSNNPPSYQVAEDGESLQLISLRVFGTSKRWKEIAERNGMQQPYKIKTGQILLLPSGKIIEAAKGDLLVLNFWRKKMGLRELDLAEKPAPKDHALTPVANRPVEPSAPIVPEVIAEPTPEPVADESLKITKKELVVAVATLQSGKIESAFDQMKKLSGSGTAPMPGETAVATKSEAVKELTQKDQRVVWLEGKTAEIIFSTLKGPATASSIDYDQAPPELLSIEEMERKKGKDITCAREPQVDIDRKWLRDSEGQLVFKVRCLGYIRADSAQFLVKQESQYFKDGGNGGVTTITEEDASRSIASVAAPVTVLDDKPFLSGIQMLREGKVANAFDEFANKSKDTLSKPENSRVVWTDGIAAQIIYKSMSTVPVLPAQVDFAKVPAGSYIFDQLERKMGRDVTCAKEPLVSDDSKEYRRGPKGEIQFRIRCLGYIRETDAG